MVAAKIMSETPNTTIVAATAAVSTIPDEEVVDEDTIMIRTIT
jgi:hypothetical protein